MIYRLHFSPSIVRGRWLITVTKGDYDNETVILTDTAKSTDEAADLGKWAVMRDQQENGTYETDIWIFNDMDWER